MIRAGKLMGTSLAAVCVIATACTSSDSNSQSSTSPPAGSAAATSPSSAAPAFAAELTPQRLLAELYASPERLAAAGAGLDLSGLHRAEAARWTVSDAPLLDELAELLGPVPSRPRDADGEPDDATRRAYAAKIDGGKLVSFKVL